MELQIREVQAVPSTFPRAGRFCRGVWRKYLHQVLEIPKKGRHFRKSESSSYINRLVDKSQLQEEGTQFFVTLRSACCSVAQPRLTLCDPMACSTPGFSVLHYLPELAQTHARWVGDAIQPSHPLASPSPPAFSLWQHQGLLGRKP